MNPQRMPVDGKSSQTIGAVIKHNLSESAISDQTLESLNVSIDRDTVLAYPELKGSENIRSIIASTAGGYISPEDVLVTTGASAALAIVETTLLSQDVHIIVVRPNHATRLGFPRTVGCDISYIDLDFDEKYRLDLNEVAAAIEPGTTKLISICTPDGATGTIRSDAELRKLAQLAKEGGCYLLVDETCADLRYPTANPVSNSVQCAASLGDHVISVSSLSKAYGAPGVRIGWLVTTNPNLQAALLAAKERMSIGKGLFDELVAEQILARRDELLRATISDLRKRRDRVAQWIAQEKEWLDWIRPQAGAMCVVKIKQEPVGGIKAFYDRLLNQYGVSIVRDDGSERSELFFRLGFGWPTAKDLDAGLTGISKALRGSAGADHPDVHGRSSIHHAAAAGDMTAFMHLLDAGTSHPDTSDRRGYTPLHLAAENGRHEIVDQLVRIADASRRNKDGQTALHLASRNGYLLVVERLTTVEGIDLNVKDNNGSTPLHGTAKNGHNEITGLLLRQPISQPDCKDSNGNTPLHLAARNGHEQVVRQLLETGEVDLTAQDSYGDSALYVASLHGHTEVVKILMEHEGVDPDSQSADGTTPAFAASRFGHVAVVKTLLNTGKIDLSKQHKDGDTALHVAAESGSTQTVKLLLDTSLLAVDERGEGGETPLMCAAQKGQRDVIEQLLCQYRANVHSKDDNGKTALHHALDGSHWEVAKYLAGSEARTRQ